MPRTPDAILDAAPVTPLPSHFLPRALRVAPKRPAAHALTGDHDRSPNLDSQLVRRVNKRREGVSVEDCLIAGTMWLAMVPCVTGGTAMAHGAAMLGLLAASVWTAIRVRHGQPRDAQLVDLLAMSMLSLGAMLSHAGTGASVHAHGGHGGGALGTIIACASAAAWILLRCVHWNRVEPKRATIMSATMVMFMLGSALKTGMT